MEVSDKLNIINSFLGDFHRTGNEYLFNCPFCYHHKKKLSLNFEKGKYKCWICDEHGSIRKLVRKRAKWDLFQKWKVLDGIVDLDINLSDLFTEKTNAHDEIFSMPEKFVTLTSKNKTLSHRKPLGYLEKRGITEDDILYWKIGFCYGGEYMDRIIFPSFNLNGDLNYFVGRTIIGDKFNKFKMPSASKDIIFNELYMDFDADVVIVEGIIDAIKSGQNSIPLLGSTLREESKLFQKIVEYDTIVYVALDPDASEKEGEIIRKLINYGIEVYKVDVLPFGDVGEMTKEEFQRRKSLAKLMTYDTLLQQELEIA